MREVPGMGVWVCQKCSFAVDEDDIVKKPRENKFRNIGVGGVPCQTETEQAQEQEAQGQKEKRKEYS